jgi:hypothetical protein
MEFQKSPNRYIDFIGLYENVFPEGFCEHIIEEFERFLNNGFCGTRQKTEKSLKIKKDDSYLFVNVNNHDPEFKSFNEEPFRVIIQKGLQNCFDNYVDEYDTLKTVDLRSSCIKIQKTQPGQGYHVWHCEQGNGNNANRCLVWAIYLNDIEEAGETEFLYQKLRVPPKKNTAMIWPAAYTHTHRGNVVHGEKSKYIVTGWFYLE